MTLARALRAAAGAASMAAALLLAGCANLPFLGKPAADGAAAPDAAASGSNAAQRAEYRLEVQAPDALRRLLRSRPIYAYRFDGTRYDAGDKLGFLKATVEFALRRHDLGATFREYLKGLKL